MGISLQEEKVTNAVSMILSLANKKKKDDVLSDGCEPVYLFVSVKKIPKDLQRLRLKLPSSVSKPNGDICLFVKDVDKKERDTDITVDYYEHLLSQRGVRNAIKAIIPVKTLKTEYKPFEAKRNLSNSYDTFLADERVVAILPRLLGKSFYGRKRIPAPINVLAKDLKAELDKSNKDIKFPISNKGSCSTLEIGHSGMSQSDLTSNILAAVEQISKSIPGTFENIKQLNIKSKFTTSIPIFMAMGGPQDVKIKSKKKKKITPEIDELSTLPGGKVAVYPDGEVVVLADGQTLKEAETKLKKRKTPKPPKRSLSKTPKKSGEKAEVPAKKLKKSKSKEGKKIK